MSVVKIRYNTEAKDGDSLKWRVLIDGVEQLAEEVNIQGLARTSTDVIEGNRIKHHISISDAEISWVGRCAFVRSRRPDFEVTKTKRGVHFRIGNQQFTLDETGPDPDPDADIQDYYIKMLTLALGGLKG